MSNEIEKTLNKLLRREQLKDDWSHISCKECKHWKVDAYSKYVESTCKRLDHKKIKFSKPYGASYDCSSSQSNVCSEFEPRDSNVYLKKHWQALFNYFYPKELLSGYIPLYYNPKYKKEDKHYTYFVSRKDFFYGDFLDENGDLKWVYRTYSKGYRTKYKILGHKIIRESNKNIPRNNIRPFNEFRYKRKILFPKIINNNKNISWKSKLYDNGTMFKDYFICGIEFPEVKYTYLYKIKDWDLFDVKELERAPKWAWVGHQPEDIATLLNLLKDTNKE